MESLNLGNFLMKLETDAELLHRYKADPVATMKAEGLTAEEQHLILEGSNLDLQAVLDDRGPFWIIRPFPRPFPKGD